LVERAEILREKGTDRNKFLRGEIDKYTWVDSGSSQLLSEVSASLLLPQLEKAHEINASRLSSWNFYFRSLENWSSNNGFDMPFSSVDFEQTAHIFYLMAPTAETRDRFVEHLKAFGVPALFHYQPLHSSPAGQRFGRAGNVSLSVSESVSTRLLRLPIYFNMTDLVLERVVNAVTCFES
jgi:dTDP-4-amino-4,6-dideoxygalactose transaminase